MASIGEDPGGRKRILFVAGDGKRKTVRLGKVSLRQAEAFKLKLESLVGEKITGQIDDEVSRWVAGLDDKAHGKLAAVGLVKARARAGDAAIGKFVDDFIARMTTAKPNTVLNMKQVRAWLVKFFGEIRDMRKITPADAEDFRVFMATEGLGENTARRHIGRCRQLFKSAIRRGVIRGSNPFEGIASKVRCGKSRQFFVTREMADAVIAACPDAQWRLLVALSRYGGIRMPSEALPLRWSDVNWEKGRLLITSPKTEHNEGGENRLIPLFPELHKPLMDAFYEAAEGAEFIITRYRDKTANLRTQFSRIVAQAGLKIWPKPWHNMRATRQTELSEKYPAHVVCAWLGNSEQIARKHYLQVTDEHFEKAAQNPAQQPSANASNHQNSNLAFVEKPVAFPVVAEPCLSVQGTEYPQGESNPCSPAENRLS